MQFDPRSPIGPDLTAIGLVLGVDPFRYLVEVSSCFNGMSQPVVRHRQEEVVP
jgi:hypothetical protein